MKLWKVVPVCNNQRLDVKDSDLLEGGLYFTFTNMYDGEVAAFKKSLLREYGCPLLVDTMLKDSYKIDLVNYNALPHVDDVSCGGRNEQDIRKGA